MRCSPGDSKPMSARAVYALKKELPIKVIQKVDWKINESIRKKSPIKSQILSENRMVHSDKKKRKQLNQSVNGLKKKPKRLSLPTRTSSSKLSSSFIKETKISSSNIANSLKGLLLPYTDKEKVLLLSGEDSSTPNICSPSSIKKAKKRGKKKNNQIKLVNSNGNIDKWVMNPKSAEEIGAMNSECSRKDGLEAFQFIVQPSNINTFFSTHWEKKPLLIKRKQADYYKGVFSTADFDKILREENVQYTKNLDVTSYSEGKRETHNPIGRAIAPVVWDYYNNGCSLRLLNPQTFHKPVWRLLSSLQEYFGSFCGANVYLTPPGTQGFAPHWDDIEAFVLQLEGKKHWRVYKPRVNGEVLPRESSSNLSQEEIGKPILDVVLEPGDLLYFPRGFIHQGNTVDDNHSLHITISTYQKTSFADLFQKMIPEALSAAAAEDVEFREGLPLNYLDYMGIAHLDLKSDKREAFNVKMQNLLKKLMNYATIDAAVDQMGKSFVHDSLPPVLNQCELSCSVFGGGDKWSKKHQRVVNRVELTPQTRIRLIRANCLRIVMEEQSVGCYYTLENSREYHEVEPQFLELEAEHAPAVEALLHVYPNYLDIEDLPLDSLEDKMILANGLWEKGLLLTDQPLEPHYD